MRVIGVIDLKGGRAVHARGGSRERYEPVQSILLAADETGDAVALARAYRDRLGLTEIYLADLDRIVSRGRLSDLVASVVAVGVPIMVDAGVSASDAARAVVDAGARRVIVGLETLSSWDDLAGIAHDVGGARVVFSLDMRGHRMVAQESSGLTRAEPTTLAREAAACGVSAIILLDLARVGQGNGPDLALMGRVRAACPAAELIAAGGVRDSQDLARLEEIGCDAALVGTALHHGTIVGRTSAPPRPL